MLILLVSPGCHSQSGLATFGKLFKAQRQNAHEQWDAVRGDMFLQLAEQHFKVGRLEEAESSLERALALSPEDHRVYVLATRLRLEQGKLAEARQAITAAAAFSRSDPQIDYLAGIVAERYGEHEMALQHYTAAASQAPQVVDYTLARAEMLVTLDRPVDALELVESRLIDFEGNRPLLLLAARINQLLGLRGPTERRCLEALRLCEDDAGCTAELGRLLLWAGAYEEAIGVLRPLVAAVAARDRMLGQTTFEGGRLEPAIRAPSASAGPPPNRTPSVSAGPPTDEEPITVEPSTVHALARAYMAVEQWAEAQWALKTQMSRGAEDPVAWCLFARAALMRGDPATAAAALKTLHANRSATPESLLLAAYVSLQREDYAAAVEAAGDALALDDQLEEAYWLIAQAERACGREKHAQREYVKALSLRPHSTITNALLDSLAPVAGSFVLSGRIEADDDDPDDPPRWSTNLASREEP